MGVLVFLWRVSRKADLQERDVRALESGASFWHVVDLLWVVLFPLLYLVS
jgi:nitric oxide reductase NorE protein